ncbi:M12 family metallo-peptidase [Nocardioides xinjiangensis]|uniref:M12 family metallo-peptidase n=1 Tax=Nocardioides xinjiangensis TaxID=2817376 RepID=UPI001B30334E|nr:M12 family metallo-peptidase [Nocardioides sp. SYSU D00778]
MSRLLRSLSVLIAVVLALAGLQALTLSGSASPPDGYWTATDARPGGDRGAVERRVEPRRYAAFTLDRAGIRAVLDRAPGEDAARDADSAGAVVAVPAPTGELIDFRVHEVAVMEAGLAARHPELKTYAGRAVGDPTATIRLDLTPMGFHASVRGSGDRSAWYVDPAWNGDDSLYLSYRHGDLPRTDRGLVEPEIDLDELDAHDHDEHGRQAGTNLAEAPGAEVSLRTYRLALVTDPSYATYFGTENVLAEKVTLMNRVNQIYNDDMAIRMLLIDETDKLNLDTPAKATEPNGPCGAQPCFTVAQFEAGCTGALLNRNRIVLGQLVGASAYDVGHIALGVNGGGVAGLGVIGGDGKARGCTGLPTPEGDYFAVDYVAHEIGHQFGGPHTFNGTQFNCGGNRGGSPYEPGSGSSIMAYAGICQQDNLQPHSDPYFSQRSITDISNTVTATRAPINEVQNVSLRGFDTDGESFVLSFNGQETAPIVRGTNYNVAGIDLAIEAVTGLGSVEVRSFGGTSTTTLDDTGFEVRFNGAPYAGTDVAQLGLTPRSGDVTGFVGETAQGGPQENGGYTVTPSGNRAPVVTAPEDKAIPYRTPFALTGEATDPDGDALVHIWEQNDRGGAAGTALGDQVKRDGPLFRIFGTYAPVTPAGALQIDSPGENHATGNPTRVFPDMAQILENNTNANNGVCPPMPPAPPSGGATNVPVPVIECFAEWLPTADYVGAPAAPQFGFPGNNEPSLNFRFTARDLAPEGGGYSYDDVKLTLAKTPGADGVAGTADDVPIGPFRVTSKAATTAAAVAGRTETIYWTNNTAALSPNVRISLSLDGGRTFPRVLAESTPNDGNAQVTWPDVETTTARIKIEAVENYFFDVNDADITIIDKSGSDPVPPTTTPTPTPTTPTTPPADKVAPRIATKVVKPLEVGTRAKLRVTVRAKGVVPSGTVRIRLRGAGEKESWTKTLTVRGRTRVTLPAFARTGKVRVVVRYLGDDAVRAGRKTIRFAVVDRSTVR